MRAPTLLLLPPGPDMLRPFGLVAEREAALGWLLLGIATAVVVVVSGLVVAGVLRPRAPGNGVERGRGGLSWIIVGGLVVPSLILVAVFVLTIRTQAAVAAPPSARELTVRLTGHQWWWEVRYLDRASEEIAVTANEIHIPVGRPVRFEISTGDVIHSFWVPQLGGKTDLIPGQRNVTWLQADSAGTYRGQCAEYCGAQHAKMALTVVADPPDAFERWRALQRTPASPPADSDAAAGREVFTRSACAQCHTIRGTPAAGRLGPDLTHLGARATIAAGTLPNSRGNLAGWIGNPQALKPGALMPAVPLRPGELQVLVTYLQSLH